MNARMRVLLYSLVFIACCIGFFMYYKNYKVALDLSTTASSTPSIYLSTTTSEVSTNEVLQGYKQYTNTKLHFSLQYPDTLSVEEYNNGNNTYTIIFQNIKDQKGFQIFATPYSETKITDERFKKDVPSGVRKNLINGQIDGATAAEFDSYDSRLGDTREIWFVHNGMLYEVNTVEMLAPFLNDIIRTWKFL